MLLTCRFQWKVGHGLLVSIQLLSCAIASNLSRWLGSVAVWLSGLVINDVTLRRLVVVWMTVCGQINHLGM